ncbi:hypothetical protein [Neptunomonas japonica]|uniref:hypothetical protein n=1 Tax=Neptunomonas japonica TaxID=417574 RepID=UPI00048F93EE|nr:hypothetical protein [Neptunomonas japonica]
MIENITRKIAQSDELYRLLSIVPIFLVFGVISMYTAVQKALPEKLELIPIVSNITDLKNNSGLVSFEGNPEKLRFPCICDYGWGYKAFDGSKTINALVQRNSDAELYAWELSINDTSIFTYEELYAERKQEKDEAIQFALYTLIGSIVGLVFYAIVYFARSRFSEREEPEIA